MKIWVNIPTIYNIVTHCVTLILLQFRLKMTARYLFMLAEN